MSEPSDYRSAMNRIAALEKELTIVYEQYATYREAAAGSIGANFDEQLMAELRTVSASNAALEKELAESKSDHADDVGTLNEVIARGAAMGKRIRELEQALPHLLDFRLEPKFDAKGTYTSAKADEWTERLGKFNAALAPEVPQAETGAAK
jgi:hypothetical protein